MKKVLGLDIAISTGYAILSERKKVIEVGVIYTPTKEFGISGLFTLREQILKIVSKHKPTDVIIEDIYYYRNLRLYKDLAIKHGVAITAVIKSVDDNIGIHWMTATSVRNILGIENGNRHQVKENVCQWASKKHKIKLRYSEDSNDDDKADAIAVAHAFLIKGTKYDKSESRSNTKRKKGSKRKVLTKKSNRKGGRKTRRNVS